ncbi:hypothetical protein KIW84_073160 [Lathyrus oleraceus]|uniref:Uncharacterized protein n=1 Tax=Pisum sativum TaxID=3888 RepID=A0A9D4VQI1_PEA|nr:hypothetical protein KIW84_073160 [Pisum sativum]
MDSVASSVVAPAGSAEDASALQVQAHEGNYASKQGTNSSRPRNQNSNAQRSNNRVCTHCGCNNHTVETCFIKHGYPPGFRNKAKSQGISAAAANTDSTSSASPQGSTTPSFGFTKEQYDSILALLQQSKSNLVVNSVSTSPFVMTSHSSNVNGKNPLLWILDIGATDHFSFDMSLFITHKSIIPIHVTLPDGSQVTTSISGTVAISPSLTLHNVLYVPSFNVNLISIAKLVDCNHCSVQISYNTCHIVQNHSKAMIGITSLHMGLYVLESLPSNSSHAVHIINRLPSPLLKYKSPYELLFKQPPVMLHLKVFGCLSYATSLQAHRTKFQPRARKVVFIGYEEGTKGFILYDLENHDIFISRNVIFYETTFPFKSHISPPAISPHTAQNLDDILLPTPQSSFGQQHSTYMTLSFDFSSSTSTDPASPTSPSSVSPVPTDLTNHNPTASTSSEPTASTSSDLF